MDVRSLTVSNGAEGGFLGGGGREREGQGGVFFFFLFPSCFPLSGVMTDLPPCSFYTYPIAGPHELLIYSLLHCLAAFVGRRGGEAGGGGVTGKMI